MPVAIKVIQASAGVCVEAMMYFGPLCLLNLDLSLIVERGMRVVMIVLLLSCP